MISTCTYIETQFTKRAWVGDILSTVFSLVRTHARVSAHPPFLAFPAIWGRTRISAHPSPFNLEARVDMYTCRLNSCHVAATCRQVQTVTVRVCHATCKAILVIHEQFGARKDKFTRYFKFALYKRRQDHRLPIDPPRFNKELTPRLPSVSDQATWRQLRKQRDLNAGVLRFACTLL